MFLYALLLFFTQDVFSVDVKVTQKNKPVYLEVILDASGSMMQTVQGVHKIVEAKKNLKAFLYSNDGISNIKIALRAYGTKKTGDCDDTALIFNFDHKSGVSDTVDMLESLTPKALAKTPLAKSMQLAAEDLKNKPGDKKIFVVTDGSETCGGDPCAVVKKLKEEYNIEVQVIGYGVDADTLQQLGCMNTDDDGPYNAKTNDDLRNAINNLNQKLSPKNLQVMSPDPHAMVNVFSIIGNKKKLVKTFDASNAVNVPPTGDNEKYLVEVHLRPTFIFPKFTLDDKEFKKLVVEGKGILRANFFDGLMNLRLVNQKGQLEGSFKSDEDAKFECGNYTLEYVAPPFVPNDSINNIVVVPNGKNLVDIDRVGGLFVTTPTKDIIGYYLFNNSQKKDAGSFITEQLAIVPAAEYTVKLLDSKIVEHVIVAGGTIKQVVVK